jgi:hypothetical protein
MPQAKKARAIGFNHLALEVGDIDEALAAFAIVAKTPMADNVEREDEA